MWGIAPLPLDVKKNADVNIHHCRIWEDDEGRARCASLRVSFESQLIELLAMRNGEMDGCSTKEGLA